MKKNRILTGCIAILLCTVLCAGCGKQESGGAVQEDAGTLSGAESTLSTEIDFLQQLATEMETETEAGTETAYNFEFLGYSGSGWLSFYTEERKQIFECGKSLDIPYAGEDISLIAHYEFGRDNIDDPTKLISATTMVLLLNDGIPQPFYWGDAEEEALYVTFQTTYAQAEDERYYQVPGEEGDYDGVVLTMDELQEKQYYPFHFTPAEVSYGKNNSMTLMFVMLQNDHFSNPHTYCTNGGMANQFLITAASEEYEKKRDVTVPVCGKVADYVRDKEDGDTAGVAITEKIVDGDQLKVNTVLNTSEQLYAAYSAHTDMEENTEMILFAFMDGEPLCVFDGSWYCNMYVDPGNLYEIPLDMSQIPPGEHLMGIMQFSVEAVGLRNLDREEQVYHVSPDLRIYNVTIP